MKKVKIEKWQDLTRKEICYQMSTKNIQKLENALENPTHDVVRVLDFVQGTGIPMIRNTFIVDGQGYSFLAYDILSLYVQSHWFEKVSINDIDFKEGRDYFLKLVGDIL